MNAEQRAAQLTTLKGWADRQGIQSSQIARILEGLIAPKGRGAPLQEPSILCPGLEARPWHDPSRFSWVKALEQAFPAIKAEMLAQYNELSTHPESETLALKGQWTTYYFFNMGMPFDDNQAACPNTARALAQVPGIDSAGMAYFSVMAPGTHVKPHCGFINTRIRCHLGLVVPPDCVMRVGSETRSWEEGKCVIFDDSFEHEVRNDSNRYRAVLLLDTWHPDLTEIERKALTVLMSPWKAELD